MNKIEAIHWQMTKAEARRRQAEADVRRLAAAMKHATSNLSLRADGSPVTCGRCGADVSTERAFSLHFVIPDPMLYNIGHCPQKAEG